MKSAVRLVLAALDDVREVGDHWQARCPAHDDKKPSLAIRDGERGVLLRCWSGCHFTAIVEAMGLKTSDLFHLPLSREEKTRRATQASRKVLGHHALVVLIGSNQAPPFSPQDVASLREAEGILSTSPESRFAAWCARSLLAARKLPERHQLRLCNEAVWLLGDAQDRHPLPMPASQQQNGTTGLKSAGSRQDGG